MFLFNNNKKKIISNIHCNYLNLLNVWHSTFEIIFITCMNQQKNQLIYIYIYIISMKLIITSKQELISIEISKRVILIMFPILSQNNDTDISMVINYCLELMTNLIEITYIYLVFFNKLLILSQILKGKRLIY